MVRGMLLLLARAIVAAAGGGASCCSPRGRGARNDIRGEKVVVVVVRAASRAAVGISLFCLFVCLSLVEGEGVEVEVRRGGKKNDGSQRSLSLSLRSSSLCNFKNIKSRTMSV